jgi:hypothetical protein
MNIPKQFQQRIKVSYPPGNHEIFEQWLIGKIPNTNGRKYLPINWCGYYVNNDYGKNKEAIRRLQSFINSLDGAEKYWTVTQYDLGIINDVSRLDLKIFGAGGGRIDLAIGLLTTTENFSFMPEKKYFCTFSGSNTHPIREDLYKRYNDKYLFTKSLPIKEYYSIINNSIFHLCPRGFGPTSFRICESLRFGSIPVYISDQYIIPYGRDFNEYGVLVHSSEIDRLDDILKGFSQAEIQAKQEAGRRIYNELYTFEGARKWILSNV